MKIKIIKEESGSFFAEVVGESGIHAVADKADKAVEYLIDIYQDILDMRKNRLTETKFNLINNQDLQTVGFTSYMMNV